MRKKVTPFCSFFSYNLFFPSSRHCVDWNVDFIVEENNHAGSLGPTSFNRPYSPNSSQKNCSPQKISFAKKKKDDFSAKKMLFVTARFFFRRKMSLPLEICRGSWKHSSGCDAIHNWVGRYLMGWWAAPPNKWRIGPSQTWYPLLKPPATSNT